MRCSAFLLAFALAFSACAESGEPGAGGGADSASGEPAAAANNTPVDTMPRQVPEGWTMGPLAARANLNNTTPGTRVPRLLMIGTEGLETSDRVMIELEAGGMPAYSAEYVTGPITECGTAKEIKPLGRAWLSLRLDPAQAHTPTGELSLGAKEVDLTGRIAKKVYMTCDFEGQVTLVFALEAKVPFRISRLEGPPRIVIDIMH